MSSTRVIDQQQRLQALDCSNSYIIQAPAGSGKTELLTQRFLALLATVEQPEEILAITFTRKAASEMRERIIKSLKLANHSKVQPELEPELTTWNLGNKVLKQNVKHQWNLLDNPQRLQVQTIDGFCASLTKRLPYLSGLGTEANTTERSANLYREAATQTLAMINGDDKKWADSIETLLLHLDGNQTRAENLLGNMLSRRDQWLRHLSHDKNDFKTFRLELENALKDLISDELAQKSNHISHAEIEELQSLSQFAIENINRTAAKAPYFENFSGNLSTSLNLETYQDWQAISRWLLIGTCKSLRKTMDKNRGFPAPSSGEDKEQQAYFKLMKGRMVTLLESLSEKQSLFIELAQLPPTCYNDEQWHLLESLMQCLTLATGILNVIFAQKSEMDFQEVSLRALHALGEEENPTDLTLALDHQLRHILIDEFQDTSHGQFQLLKKLLRGWESNDGRSLFLVGDPMQSIYRFREADVGLFLQVRKKGIANIQPIPLQLTVNFRSKQNIVNWVNQHFANILPTQENISHGAVTYAESIAFDNSDKGGVEVYAHFDESGQCEAEKLADLVEQHINNNEVASLAVLVKSRTQLLTLMPAFQRRDLKFRATEIELLGKRPVITDFQMLTRALYDANDRVAWLALLRAPWCGLTLADLLIVADKKTSCILFNCQSEQLLQQLSDDGLARLSHCITKILPWISFNSRGTIRQSVEGCWLSLDGPAYLNQKVDLQAAELFLNLLSTIEQGGVIKEPEELKQRLAELYAPVAADAHANLQLMTIHKSKGLEFDTVILPALNSGSKHDDHSLLRWMEVSLNNQARLLMAPVHAHKNEPDLVYDYLSSIAKKQRHFEAGRQLYVACTRAKKRLILTATLNTKDGIDVDELSAKKGSQLDALWPATKTAIHEAFQQFNVDDDQILPAEEQEKDYRLWRAENYSEEIASHLLNQTDDIDVPASPSFEQPILYTASAMKRHVGTATHHWLEQIADDLENWSNERITAQQQMIKNYLRQLGVSSIELDKALKLVIQNLHNTLDDEQGRFLLSKHAQAVSEYAFERFEEDGVKSYIIDRSFIDENNVRWIIDYKTSSHDGAGRDDFLEEQKNYYQKQLENYASLFAENEDRAIRLVLYFTTYKKMISWDWQR